MVQYTALASNPYGLEANAIGAYFNPLVSVGGKQVGGIALEAHVAAWYLQHTADVDGVPPILSPVDSRTATSVSITGGTIHNMSGQSFGNIVVTTTEPTTVNSIWPGTRPLIVSTNDNYGTEITDLSSINKGEDEWSYLDFIAPGLPISADPLNPTRYSLGEEISETKTTGPVLVDAITATDFANDDPSQMLRIEKSVTSVFEQGS